MDLAAPDLVVFGGPSVHTVEGHGSPIVAGAGLITALAARVAGRRVGLVCAVPPVLPAAVGRCFGPAGLDPGGLARRPGCLPDFHISYDEEGRAAYVLAAPGVEEQTAVDQMPARWWGARWVHVCPLGGSVERQLAVVEALRAGGFGGGISAGTFPRATVAPAAVRALAARVDLFFCNEGEAAAIFGAERPGELVLTRGAAGLERWSGGRRWAFSAPSARVVDPTGAGDAVCGGWLAGHLGGLDMDGAAALAQSLAATVLGGWGAQSLVAALPASVEIATAAASPAEGRAWVVPSQVERVGAALAAEAQAAAIDFSRPPFPAAGAPGAAALLALATLHQYGFWTTDPTGTWAGSMFAVKQGQRYKGSDFVWACFTAAAAADPTVLDPARLATEPLLFDAICADDDGHCPIPDVASHRLLQMGYGAALRDAGGWERILDEVGRSAQPGAALLARLSRLPGYAEDPLAKKATLLLLILTTRPERFVRLGADERLGPIVDYHLMRGCLRSGVVGVDPALAARLAARQTITGAEEAAVRMACRAALRDLESASGLGAAAIDGYFFGLGRRLCLEASPPRCTDCALAPRCAQRVDLFQPVYRTTAY